MTEWNGFKGRAKRQMFRFSCAGSDIRIAAGSLDDTLTVELRA